jgi:hypothetical protein
LLLPIFLLLLVLLYAGVNRAASVFAIFETIVVFSMPTVVFFTTSVSAVGGVPAVAGSSSQDERKQKCELGDVISGGNFRKESQQMN